MLRRDDMIFAYATDDQTLISFASEQDAVAYAEGIDVEDGIWLFFSDSGAALEPIFSMPNQRGGLVVASGRYSLHPAGEPSAPDLHGLLHEVAHVEGELPSIEAVRRFLARVAKQGMADRVIGSPAVR